MRIGGDGATEAFDGLRGEIALMRRAVERLAAEKADAPDYTVTLGKISRDERQAAERLEAMANSPALSLTPVAIGTQVERVAARGLRRADRQTIDGVRRELAGGQQSNHRTRIVRAQRRAAVLLVSRCERVWVYCRAAVPHTAWRPDRADFPGEVAFWQENRGVGDGNLDAGGWPSTYGDE